MNRTDKTNYYLDIAETVLSRGTCLRRNYGAIIVNSDQIVSTGYTGSPRGAINCIDLGSCERNKRSIPSGERYELCKSVHAEANAIIHAARSDMMGATIYLVGKEAQSGKYVEKAEPCLMCRRLILNAGIVRVISRIDKENFDVFEVEEFIAKGII
jgi:dCMP deaminase